MTNKTKSKTILCIPGNWKDRAEIVSKIAANNSNKYIFAGNILLDIIGNKRIEMEICDQDIRMIESFKWAGINRDISEDFLTKIEKHNFVIYLTIETNGFENARAIAEAGKAVLKAGGIGIKVETAGKAFTIENWIALIESSEDAKFYQMFVIDNLINENGEIYSCGMHNLGLRDSILLDKNVEKVREIISIFGLHQVIDKPKIKVGQTFSINKKAEIYNLSEEQNQPNKKDELLKNPFGMWRLERKASR